MQLNTNKFIQLVLWTCLFFLKVPVVIPANILIWQGVGTHSTRISMFPLMESLIEKGHSVSFLSAFKNIEPIENSSVNYILPNKLHQVMRSSWEDLVNFYEIRQIPYGKVLSWYHIRDFGVLTCELLYSDDEFIDWATLAKFDLVIVEISVNECAYGFIHLWKSKLIVYSTTTALAPLYDAHGIPDESASITDLLLAYEGPMTFGQRFVNAWHSISYSLTRQWLYLPRLEEITRRGLGSRVDDLPRFSDIEKNASLVFLTTHFSYEMPRSLPPNVKAIGGTVITNTKSSLPKGMNDFINSAESGFIYISFGTVTDFTHFDLQVQVEFINALKSFPEMRFIWKSAKPIDATQLPENVLLTKWAPQQTLLAHSQIKAFITHAGMGSTTEAIHFSVPLICLPVMMDQDLNANVIVAREAGIKLEIIDLKSFHLAGAISEVLHNKTYREGMNRLTKLFKDRPIPPLEEATWWIEYVLRHENIYEILTPPSTFQPWWVRRQIDVWLTSSILLILILMFPMFLVKRIGKFILLRTFYSTKNEQRKGKQE